MVITKTAHDILHITLARPERANAYNGAMAEELAKAFASANANPGLLAVILQGEGKNFCSGADLDWIKNLQSKEDLRVLVRMYQALIKIEIPVICAAQGKIRGGGLGLIAASDIVICDPTTDFALSEARQGLIPGIITPLAVQKIGASHFAELALTARTFTATAAVTYGLAHHLFPQAQWPAELEKILVDLRASDLEALREIKKTLRLCLNARPGMLEEMMEHSSALALRQ